jgi:flagellar basal-body rod protein FlgC
MGVRAIPVSSIFAIAQSGLAAANSMLNVSASNIANIDDASPVGALGGFDPSQIETSPAPGGGVIAQAVTVKPAQLIAFNPTSPVANGQGLVDMPDIDPITEVTNQLAAGVAFAYSLAALKVAEQEQQQTLDMTA